MYVGLWPSAQYACASPHVCRVCMCVIIHVHSATCVGPITRVACASSHVRTCAIMCVHCAVCGCVPACVSTMQSVCVPSRVCTVCSSATRVWTVQGAGDVCPGATAETPAGRGLRGPLQAAPEPPTPQTGSGVLVPGRPHLRQAGGGDGAGSPQGGPCVSAQSGRGLIPGAWHPHVGGPACRRGLRRRSGRGRQAAGPGQPSPGCRRPARFPTGWRRGAPQK